MKATTVFLPILVSLAISAGGGAHASEAVFFARPGSTAPFSPAVRAGDFIFVSGQIGITRDGKVPVPMAEQARLAMDNLHSALDLAGAGFDDVVKCTVMMVDMKQWAEFNKAYLTYFKPGRLPARSAFGTSSLAFNAGVEVECIAYKPLGGAQ